MSLALAVFKNRIASLFESSDRFIIIDLSSQNRDESLIVTITNNSPTALLQILTSNNVRVLICGAISDCMKQMLESQKIDVIPWITGEIENVVTAYKLGRLLSPPFIMPGCRGIKGRRRYHWGHRNR